MVKTTLVGPDLERGEEILDALDAAGFPVTVALWILQKDRDDWTLVIGTPVYDQLGAREAYGRLIELLSSTHPFAVHDLPIRLESNRRPLIKGLRKTFGKRESVKGMRIGLQSIGDTWIDDGYVYRIKP
jgi:hypothetical protein